MPTTPPEQGANACLRGQEFATCAREYCLLVWQKTVPCLWSSSTADSGEVHSHGSWLLVLLTVPFLVIDFALLAL